MKGSAHPVVDVVVPARNCASTLAGVVAAFPTRAHRSVVVVDNGSADNTGQVGRDAGAVVLREPRGGYGAACMRAVAHLSSLPHPPDVVVFVSGDGSDDPADLPTLLEPIDDDNAELVIGVGEREGSARPSASNRVALRLIGAIYRHRFEDLGPFRAVRFPALIALGMSDRGDGWNVEMQVKALKLGLHIAEVPVRRRPAAGARRRGTLASVETTGRMLFQIFRHATVR